MASVVWCRPYSNRNKKAVCQACRSHKTRKYGSARCCDCHICKWSGQHRNLHAVVCGKRCASRSGAGRSSLRASGCVVRCWLSDSSAKSGCLHSATVGTLDCARGSYRPRDLYPPNLRRRTVPLPKFGSSVICFPFCWSHGNCCRDYSDYAMKLPGETDTLFNSLRQSAKPKPVSAIETLIQDGPDRELCRINALAFAAKHKLDEEDVIAAFLHAARLGIFDMSWNILCPACGGVLDSGATLKTVKQA